MHSFIKPEKGTSLAYIDWNQQEFGIAAALSSDKKMIAAYESGDPYLQFAIDIGAIPEDATKHKYPEEREQYKNALLAILYGIGSESLGRMLSISNFQADQIIKQFQSCYRAYANWCYYQINQALFCCEIRTQFGWSRKISPDTRENSIKNFPIQTYGAELMRQATCILIESGIKVCTSVHDAFLIESSTTSIHKTVKKTKELMAQASRQVLDGFELTSDDEIISYPHRFSNDDQESIWNAAIPVIRRLGNG
jgi:DNA polymerase I-like protein with 3'-5' exonuclease and polymerase domains